MPDPTAPDRTPGSAVRRPRVLERLVVVAAVAAALVAVGAWIALNRPDGAAEAAGASSSVGTSGGSFSETSGAPAAGATDAAAGAGDQADAPADASAAPAAGSPDAAGPTAGTGGTRSTGAAATTAARGTGGTAPLSPTTTFLNQLAASGLGPPVDDTQKLAMADDVCQELKNGSKYADVVRALTFAGATDEQAANFAKLSITNLCPKFPIGR
jgi:hypothetical protein